MTSGSRIAERAFLGSQLSSFGPRLSFQESRASVSFAVYGRRLKVVRRLQTLKTSESGRDRGPLMVVIRCTQKLLRRIGPSGPTDEKSTARLGDWLANLLGVAQRRFVLLVSEPT
jgi:hypothetical protein